MSTREDVIHNGNVFLAAVLITGSSSLPLLLLAPFVPLLGGAVFVVVNELLVVVVVDVTGVVVVVGTVVLVVVVVVVVVDVVVVVVLSAQYFICRVRRGIVLLQKTASNLFLYSISFVKRSTVSNSGQRKKQPSKLHL